MNDKLEKLTSNPMPGRTVRVIVPAKVAFNLPDLQRSLASLAERLGHSDCMSGANCLFDLERNFAVDPATLAVHHVVQR